MSARISVAQVLHSGQQLSDVNCCLLPPVCLPCTSRAGSQCCCLPHSPGSSSQRYVSGLTMCTLPVAFRVPAAVCLIPSTCCLIHLLCLLCAHPLLCASPSCLRCAPPARIPMPTALLQSTAPCRRPFSPWCDLPPKRLKPSGLLRPQKFSERRRATSWVRTTKRRRRSSGGCSRRRDCHFDSTSWLSLLKDLMKVQGGAIK